ncbi:hypothetical protein [Hymenobacter terrestris]|uniref:DUF1735 domain-containing protein n=1 Tax=Hymenobacter terrestris TaxID=2748310 RepID=A0ABX2Q2C8_9BACT|nr:hypothetical protein [Hymenobacter terrestris]NVO85084.1 hypothetical protein [Hymenobacter terrestris]
MKKYLVKLCALAVLSTGLLACEKDFGPNDLGPLEDSIANTPVTVTNAEFFERYPGVTTSIAAGGNINIQLAVPAGNVIKQITKVATSTATSINLGNLNSTTAASAYNTAPIPGNGTNTITFTTNLQRDYLPYRIRVGTSAGPAGPAAGTPPRLTAPVPSTTAVPTDIGFYFRIELEDGTILIPRPVRVRVIP